MYNNPGEPNWDDVELLVLMDLEGQRIVRVFEKHPELTYNEYWYRPGTEPQFMGVNEPPDFGERRQLSGEAAKETTFDFLRG